LVPTDIVPEYQVSHGAKKKSLLIHPNLDSFLTFHIANFFRNGFTNLEKMEVHCGKVEVHYGKVEVHQGKMEVHREKVEVPTKLRKFCLFFFSTKWNRLKSHGQNF